MSIVILALVLGLLLILVGGMRGLRTIFTLAVNAVIFVILAWAILGGVSPILASVIACVVICLLTLFFNTGLNAKSLTAFASVTAVVLFMWFIMDMTGRGARIEGFSFQKLSDIAGYSWIINIDMGDLAVACMLIGLIGAIIDTSVAVASAQFEVAENNPDISFGQLYVSGCRVGRDLLGTTCNTLFFAFLGGYLTLLIWFCLYKYSFAEIINSAVFVEEFIRIMASALGCVLIMPITSLFGAVLLRTKMSRILGFFERAKERINIWLNSNPYSEDEMKPDNDYNESENKK